MINSYKCAPSRTKTKNQRRNIGAKILPILGVSILLASCAALTDNQIVRTITGKATGKEISNEKNSGRIAVLGLDQVLALDPALAEVTVTAPAATALVNWRNAGGIPSGAPQNIQGDGQLSIAWKRRIGAGGRTGSGLIAPPIVSENKLYLTDVNMVLHAVDAGTGAGLWSSRLSEVSTRGRFGGRSSAVSGGIGIEGNNIIVSSGYGEIIGVDSTAGAIKWRTKTNAPVHTSPLVINSRAYAVGNDSELYAINVDTGDIVWTQNTSAESARVYSSSSSAILGETLVTPFASGDMVASLAINGRRLWSEPLTRLDSGTSLSAINDIAGHPVIAGGNVYGASQSGVVVAIDLRSGVRLWDKPVGSIQSPWVSGDFLYVVSTNSELVCLSTKDGGVKWIKQLAQYQKPNKRKGRITWTGPIMVDGQLVLGSSTGDIITVRIADGEITNTIRTKESLLIPPIAANGTVYFYSASSEVIALR